MYENYVNFLLVRDLGSNRVRSNMYYYKSNEKKQYKFKIYFQV